MSVTFSARRAIAIEARPFDGIDGGREDTVARRGGTLKQARELGRIIEQRRTDPEQALARGHADDDESTYR